MTDLISKLALEWDHFTWPSQRRWWCIRGQAQWLTQKVALYVRKVGLKKLPTPLKVLLIGSCGGALLMKHDLTLLGMSYATKKNAHLWRHLGAFFIRLIELCRVSN